MLSSVMIYETSQRLQLCGGDVKMCPVYACAVCTPTYYAQCDANMSLDR